MSNDDLARLLYLSLLMAAVSGWVWVEYRHRRGHAVRVLMAWGLIFVGAAAGYGLWHDLRRDILPVQTVEAGRVVIPRAPDGHYYLRLQINGQSVLFMVDTGASEIVLSPADADALGLDPLSLHFLGEAETANGVVRTARVVLPSVVLGPFSDSDVAAYVNEADMQTSLLGMSYLGRFRIRLDDSQMILER